MPSKIDAPVSKGFFGDLFLGFLAIIIGESIGLGLVTDKIPLDLLATRSLVYLLCVLMALILTKSWQNVWRWTSSDDLVRVAQTIVLAAITYLLIASLYFRPFSAIAPLLTAFIMTSFMMGARGFARLISSGGDFKALTALFRPVVKDAPLAILVGPTDIVTQSLHELRKTGPLPFRPIAIISTSGNHINKVFAGAKVHSGENISQILPRITRAALSENNEVRIILVGDLHSNDTKQAAIDIVSNTNAKLSRMPEIGSKELSNVNPQDVLGRKRHILSEAGPSILIRHKTVLITGAGGTIGGELAKQVARLQPGRLLLVDSSENNLYSIHQSLSEDFPTLNIIPKLIDIRESDQINELFQTHEPQIIIHAAANKHVPMLESHPREAIRVNLGGTKNVADAALRYQSEIFILVSTDKAVNPSNMMGAAKRAAELYVRKCFNEANGRFYSVRFGNVLGSSGSVMPLFERQISRMGPVTITHRDMTRWFMTVEEAVGLVLQGAALGAGAVKSQNGQQNKLDQPLLVLDMGEPVRIVDFAETMIRLRGFEPYKEINIIEIGPRPGEKLHEELFYSSEKVQSTDVEGIYCAKPAGDLPKDLDAMVTQTIKNAENNKIDAAIAGLKEIVPEFIMYKQ